MESVICYIVGGLTIALVGAICGMAILYKRSAKFREWNEESDPDKYEKLKK